MSSKITESINKQASEWFVLMQSSSVAESDRSAFLHWFNQCSEHQEAFRAYESLWHDLGQLATTEEGQRLKDSIDSFSVGYFLKHVRASLSKILPFFTGALSLHDGILKWSRSEVAGSPHVGRFALAGVVLLMAVFLFNNLSVNKLDIQSHQTAVAQIKEIHLEDGTIIALSGKSRMAAWSTENERHVELFEGQAFFEVAKNPDKPFYVKTGDTMIRVVGTQFDVNRTSSRVSIAVLEGIVKVSGILNDSKTAAETQSITVTKGLQVSRDAAGVFTPVESVDEKNIANWRIGRLVYNNARLCDVIDDVNRYSENKVLLDKSLHNIKVTISFEIDQVDSLPMLLSKMLPIEYTRETSGRTFVRPSPK
jgi:transmembrane sensor